MRSNAKVYRGSTRVANGQHLVFIDEPFGTAGYATEMLDPRDSQKLINHSPDGFSWGYCGSGPAQLALAMLLDYYGQTSPNITIYQRFKERAIATIPKDVATWRITGAEIDAHVAAIRAEAGSAA